MTLSKVSGQLADSTLDLVTAQGRTAEVRVYATPDSLDVLAATALFLARGFVTTCRLDRATVTMVRSDLDWRLVGRDARPALVVAARSTATADDDSQTYAVPKLAPKRDVEAAALFDERVRGGGSEADALAETQKRFRLPKSWRPASAETLRRAVGRETPGAEDAPTYPAVAATIKSACRGYDGLKGR